MMTPFSDAIARLLDVPLGWTLSLPREATVAIVALLTALVLTLVRRFTTNQDRLRRARQDLSRLKVLMRQHRSGKDKAALERTRATTTSIKLIQMRAEGLGLVVSLIPIGALALWAVERLDYLPIRPGGPITLSARFSPAAIGSVTHLVPPEGARLESSPVQVVAADAEGGHGVAVWSLVPDERVDRLELTLRHQRQTVSHALRVGGPIYEPPRIEHEGGAILTTEASLTRFLLFGVVPGVPALGLAPWLVAYLLLAIPLTPLLRYILGVS